MRRARFALARKLMRLAAIVEPDDGFDMREIPNILGAPPAGIDRTPKSWWRARDDGAD